MRVFVRACARVSVCVWVRACVRACRCQRRRRHKTRLRSTGGVEFWRSGGKEFFLDKCPQRKNVK